MTKYIKIFLLIIYIGSNTGFTYGMFYIENKSPVLANMDYSNKILLYNKNDNIYAGELIIREIIPSKNGTNTIVISEDFIIYEPLIILEPKQEKHVDFQYIGTEDFVQRFFNITLEAVDMMKKTSRSAPGRISIKMDFLIHYSEEFTLSKDNRGPKIIINKEKTDYGIKVTLTNKGNAVSLDDKKIIVAHKRKKISDLHLTGTLLNNIPYTTTIPIDFEFKGKDIKVKLQ